MAFVKKLKTKTSWCLKAVLIGCASMALVSCEGDPGKVEVELKETAAYTKITSYTKALRDIGMMSEIYGTGALRILASPIGDNTGSSMPTGGEIPRDITEMMKSALNAIGGNVLYIPYDPSFIQNSMVTGYSAFEDKISPDVVVTGGITEFDRGLETRGKGTEAGFEADINIGSNAPVSGKVGFDYSDVNKSGLARITLDFNLVNFRTMAGIPRMNAVNSIEVHKAMAEKELGVTLFGANFGRQGSIKKVQGRHAAVRLLVELSMIQVVGKYSVLPYWRVLGEDAQPDDVVTDAFIKGYYKMAPADQIAAVQEWLFLHGNDIQINGTLDALTISAIQRFNPSFSGANGMVDADTASKIYMSIPIDNNAYGRRMMLASGTYTAPASLPAAPAPEYVPSVAVAPAPAPSAHVPVEEAPPVQAKPQQAPIAAAPPPTPQPKPAQAAAQPRQPVSTVETAQVGGVKRQTTKSSRSIGRMLGDSDW